MSETIMNEQKREQLSALVDNELDHDASSMINYLLENTEAKETWTRYHLIGDSLKGHLPANYGNTVDRVSQAIASEPTVLIPRKRLSNGNLMKPVMGFAIAASVAAVAIFNVQQARQTPTPITKQSIAIEPTMTKSVPSIAMPQLVSRQKEPTKTQIYQNPNARLSRYLVNYNEYRVNTGVGAMPPHVRMVANEVEATNK